MIRKHHIFEIHNFKITYFASIIHDTGHRTDYPKYGTKVLFWTFCQDNSYKYETNGIPRL